MGAQKPQGTQLKQAVLACVGCLVVFTLLSSALSGRGPSGAGAGGRWIRAQRHQQPAVGEVERLRGRYLDAVRDSLTGVHLQTPTVVVKKHQSASELEHVPFNPAARARGNDWPLFGLSMSGTMRLDSLRALLEDALRRGVPGSFVECGVWRGGASLFAKAVLTAHGAQRDVHLVDSFQGLPPNTTAQDQQWWGEMDYLRVSQPEVQSGFVRFGLLDNSVHFHKGYFRYSLPAWQAGDDSPIAVLRMDGDMFESTMDILYNLWDAVSVGGYVIIDDWTIPECQRAVREFFSRNGLSLKVTQIDDYAGWLQKTEATPVDHGWYERFNSSRSDADAGGRSRRRTA